MNTSRFNYRSLWITQTLSLVGVSVTGFALGIWVFTTHKSIFGFALVTLFATVPGLIITVLVGPLVDRWSKRLVMLNCDIGLLVASGAVLTLHNTGSLRFWHACALAAVGSLLGTVHRLAYVASIVDLVPRSRLTRTNNLMTSSISITAVLAPALGGSLMVWSDLNGILILDLVTGVGAVVYLCWCRFPNFGGSASDDGTDMTLYSQLSYGFRHITRSPVLAPLAIVGILYTLLLTVLGVLFSPLILTLSNSQTLGSMVAVGGLGMICGSVFIALVPFDHNPARGVMAGVVLLGAVTTLTTFVPYIQLYYVAIFLAYFSAPFHNTYSQTVFQIKTPPQHQAKIFAARQVMIGAFSPLILLTLPAFADHLVSYQPTSGGSSKLLLHALASAAGDEPAERIAFLLSCTGLLYLIGNLIPLCRLISPRSTFTLPMLPAQRDPTNG